MKIQVNGKEREVADGTSLQALLEGLGVPCAKAVVSVNDEVVQRGDFGKTILKDGDAVDIFSFVGGG